MKDIEKKIKTLIDEINFHNYQYHGMDDPKIKKAEDIGVSIINEDQMLDLIKYG